MIVFVSIYCHPALPPEGQAASHCVKFGGRTTEEIALAFLVTPATLAQHIVRAKAVVRDKAILTKCSCRKILRRLEAVLQVVYLVFNAGYLAEAAGAEWSREAIRLLLDRLIDSHALANGNTLEQVSNWSHLFFELGS